MFAGDKSKLMCDSYTGSPALSRKNGDDGLDASSQDDPPDRDNASPATEATLLGNVT